MCSQKSRLLAEVPEEGVSVFCLWLSDKWQQYAYFYDNDLGTELLGAEEGHVCDFCKAGTCVREVRFYENSENFVILHCHTVKDFN